MQGCHRHSKSKEIKGRQQQLINFYSAANSFSPSLTTKGAYNLMSPPQPYTQWGQIGWKPINVSESCAVGGNLST